MWEPISICVDVSETIEALAQELETLLGIKFERPDDNPYIHYQISFDQIFLTLGTHSLVNDRDLLFEDYPFEIEMSTYGFYDWEESERRLKGFSIMLFNKLRDQRKYGLLMVNNVDIKLDEFRPNNI